MAGKRWFAAASLVAMLVAAPFARAAYTTPDLPDDPAAVQTETAPPVPLTPEQEREKAQAQLAAQEHQRVFGVMATFNTTRNKDALPLSARQKYQLFFKSATDPWPFLLTAFSSGIDQAQNSFPQYHQGWKGYGKRFGADYADYFTGNLFGNAVLAAALKEDPRYFQKGTGRVSSRILWAAASTVWCKRDNGSWGPNYANVVGNYIGSAISNLYYPTQDRTVAGTFERGTTVTAEAIVGSEVIEFWPDIVRHHNRKKAEKLARQAAQSAPSVQN